LRELFTVLCAVLFAASAYEVWKRREPTAFLGILLAVVLTVFIWTGVTALAVVAVALILARIWARRSPEGARALAGRILGPLARAPGERDGEDAGDPAEVVGWLEREGSPRSIPDIDGRLRHPAGEVRRAAFGALARIGTPAARTALLEGIGGEADPAIRRAALGAAFGAWGAGGLEEALGKLGPGARVEYLDALLGAGKDSAAEREVAARIGAGDPDTAVRVKAGELARKIHGGGGA